MLHNITAAKLKRLRKLNDSFQTYLDNEIISEITEEYRAAIDVQEPFERLKQLRAIHSWIFVNNLTELVPGEFFNELCEVINSLTYSLFNLQLISCFAVPPPTKLNRVCPDCKGSYIKLNGAVCNCPA